MKKLCFGLTAFSIFSIIGCATNDQELTMEGAQAKSQQSNPDSVSTSFSGIVVPRETDEANEDIFIDLSADGSLEEFDVINSLYPNGLPVLSEGVITTERCLVKIEVTRTFSDAPTDRTYTVLFGPRPGVEESVSATVDSSTGKLELSGGFAVFWGIHPFMQADVVSVAADGTQLIVESFEGVGERVNRVYLIEKLAFTTVDVWHTVHPSTTTPLSKNGHYCEITAGRDIVSEEAVPPRPVDPTAPVDPIRLFYDRAIALGNLAEMP